MTNSILTAASEHLSDVALLGAKNSASKYKVDPRIESALAEIDRNAFITSEGAGLVVGRSIPSTETLRHIFSILTLPQSPKILQVGAGLGYASAVLSRMASQVIAIEKVVSLATAITEKAHKLGLANIIVRQGDGSGGAPQDAPFDLILVSTPNIEHKSTLLKQLSPRGQLVCIEYAEASLLMLVKYVNDGHHNYIRSEHGFIDFVQNKDEILIELGFVTDDILREARLLSKAKKTRLMDEVRLLISLNDLELYPPWQNSMA